MPWLPQQHRLFEAAAASPEIAKQAGIPQAAAKRMAGEGVKKVTKALTKRANRQGAW